MANRAYNGQTPIFAGHSEMHRRVQQLDWAATALGPVERWPQSLTTVVKTLLASRYPMILIWGPHLIQFYNDAYSTLIGDKHPAALGQDIRVTLAEGWDTLGPLIEDVMRTGEANWNPALLLVLERAGYREEAYFDVSHAPAEDDTGAVVGMFAVCSEVTEGVLGERRLRLLRDLALRAGEARSIVPTCDALIAAVAEHHLDVPFAALYLREDDALCLRAATGIAPGAAIPERVALTSAVAWPFASAASGQTVVESDLGRLARVTGGPWNEPVTTAIALPIAVGHQAQPSGVVVFGVSPNRALDERYHAFFELLAGQMAAAVGNAQTHEEERRRGEALAQLDRAKTEFFSNVSHEFRTPLTLLLGPLEELLAEPNGPLHAADRANLEIAQRNALRLLKLVNSLLDFSRAEADRARALFEPANLAVRTADLASLFRSAIEKAGLELIVDCPPLPEPIFVDPDMWEKIVLNLLSNALKFTHAGSITVRQTIRAGALELTVSDTGTGIAAHELPHVFERFHRVEGAAGRTHEGTGIGLALVRELVQMHGGSVTVESAVGYGTRFTVALPTGRAHLPPERISAVPVPGSNRADAFVAEALRWLPDAEPEPQPATNGSPPRARILLADDNADMREYVRKLLAARYDVVTVSDGAAALAAAQEQPPDLVLSDIMMPRLDGVGLLHALRAASQTRTIPVILLSAQAGDDARASGLEIGADDYLIKPFAARELLARITTHLDLAAMRRAAEAERAQRSAAEATLRERDQFLSLAAHELKTPLTGIKGYIEIFVRRMARTEALDERDRRTLQVIRTQVDRLEALVAVLLDLSRLATDQFVLQRRRIDLGDMLRRCCDDTRLLLDRHALRVDVPAAPLWVDGDALRLEQVLQNLIGNALKYSPSGGDIELSAAREGDDVVLRVRDYGIGIPAPNLPQIFERFVRAANIDQLQISGLGIGLYVVREIVTRHGGTVDVESQEGVGSIFTVQLPAADAAERIPAHAAGG